MAIIPSSFLDAVVAIGVAVPEGKKWIGTGFIVGRKEKDDPMLSTYYLVTNKHVVERQQQVYVRFNSIGGEFVKDYIIDLFDNAGKPLFSAHPQKEADVIAIQLYPQTLINDQSIWGSFDLDDHALTLEQMQQSGVDEGSLIYALGFPMNLVDEIKTPICRLGCISRITDAFILKEKYPVFLVDAQTFPGNSGGPIINRPEYMSITGAPGNGKAYLVGILSAYILYRDTLCSRQTGMDKMITEENSGLTIVHPVDRIKEVVELEWERMERFQAAAKEEQNDSQAEEKGVAV